VKIEAAQVSMLTITDAPNLDPIRVVTENYKPGQGRIVIQCWDRAWAAAWMGMSGRTIEQFFIACDWDYLFSNLTNGLHGLRQDAKKRDKEYVRRIIEAVQTAFRAQASKATATDGAKPLKRCAAGRDGECGHAQCPQLRDHEPAATGRHCPLDNHSED